MARRRYRKALYPHAAVTIEPNHIQPYPRDYEEGRGEIDTLMAEICNTLEAYRTSTEEDEYEIPPGFEDYGESKELIRCYYGVYSVNDDGEIIN